MTGVRYALARGLQERETVAEAAVRYVRTSVPDALGALKPAPQQLIEMAEAKLEGGGPVAENTARQRASQFRPAFHPEPTWMP